MMKLLNMHKKSVIVLVISLVCLLHSQASAWLFYVTPSFEGKLTDALTGAGIENAVLEVRWGKMIYTPIHPHSTTIDKRYFVSDKNGFYRIPKKLSVHVLSKFTVIHFVIRHPLHETKSFTWGGKRLEALKQKRVPPGAGQGKELEEYKAVFQEGKMVFNTSFLSLEEKFKEKPNVGGLHGSLWGEILEEGWKYFGAARKLNIPMELDEVFQKWEVILNRFEDSQKVHFWLEESKRRIKQSIEE